MDNLRIEAVYRIQHRHEDQWHEMQRRPHGTQPGGDIERELGRGHVYECMRCDERVTVVPHGLTDAAE